jgi:hypothetical protein
MKCHQYPGEQPDLHDSCPVSEAPTQLRLCTFCESKPVGSSFEGSYYQPQSRNAAMYRCSELIKPLLAAVGCVHCLMPQVLASVCSQPRRCQLASYCWYHNRWQQLQWSLTKQQQVGWAVQPLDGVLMMQARSIRVGFSGWYTLDNAPT